MNSSILPQKQIELMNDIGQVLRYIDEQKEKVETFKTTMQQLMLANSIKSLKHEGYFTLTAVAETTSMSFDTAAFKVDYPELYAKYTKKSNKAGFLKITKH
jgi:hypothetical protein